MSDEAKNDDWTCGGWSKSSGRSLLRLSNLTLEEKLRWIADASKFTDDVKAWRRSQGLPTISQNDEIEWLKQVANHFVKAKNNDWHCGGWEGAERETLRHMISLTFEEKIQWLEQAQKMIAAMHGEGGGAVTIRFAHSPQATRRPRRQVVETENRRPLKTRSKPWAQALARFLAERRGEAECHFRGRARVCVAGRRLLVGGAAVALSWLAAAACIQLRLLCNLMDGLVAVEGGLKSNFGDLYNEIPDRIADAALFVCAGHASGACRARMDLRGAGGLHSLPARVRRVAGAEAGIFAGRWRSSSGCLCSRWVASGWRPVA